MSLLSDLFLTGASALALFPFVGAFGARATGDYKISRSLRFRASALAQAKFTPSSAGTRTIGTFHTGLKQSGQAAAQTLISAYVDASNSARIAFNSSYQLRVEFVIAGTTYAWVSNRAFRDPGAHGDITVSWNTVTQTLSAWFKNDVITWASSATLPASGNTAFGYNGQHTIGADWNGSAYSNYLDGLLWETALCIGAAYSASTFGQLSATTGEWDPKAFSVSYGAQGGWWRWANYSTQAALGTDSSGSGNTLTIANISVTAGSTYDSFVDTPTNSGTDAGAGGEVVGNYCTLDPLDHSSVSAVISNGNLTVIGTATDSGAFSGTLFANTGLFLWEAARVGTGGFGYVGVNQPGIANRTNAEAGIGNAGLMYRSDGSVTSFSVAGTALATWNTAGEIILIALDLVNGAIYYWKGGSWLNGGVPTSGASRTGAVATWTPGAYTLSPAGGGYNGNGVHLNFGQQPFDASTASARAALSAAGFKCLCTQNIPDPVIPNPKLHFDVVLAAGASIKASCEALFTYFVELIKDRANVNNYQLIDTARGAALVTQINTTAVETTYTAPAGSSVGWVWNLGGAPASNTNGSITSQVAVNALAGISVVKYTGTGAAATIGHGLNAVLKMAIIKSRNLVSTGLVYHASLGNTSMVPLSNAAASASALYFNNTTPTSSVLSVGYAGGVNNSGDDTYEALCFAEVPGFSAFGKFTANALADGTFIPLPFRARMFWCKRTDDVGDWFIFDSARDTYNVASAALLTDTTAAETTTPTLDFLSNGVKLRASAGLNAAGNYIYAAFAECPSKTARAR